ncbi:ATP synthase F1 subunit delta [Sulfobacillus harzensis]|uniref:ATP synthase subunit delta n=1 Tax=Sulfobacillus harzensis TaxID=2729629 RepID=A0A7Y0L0F1_9FIRM|nr:ATP synthase F1 subunit delta [Sulfobacillus harzensis]NMP21006.1 ATP synthase F1 subunit delta [Sulfobacillus harzensis]
MKQAVIARPYARALFELAKSAHKEERVAEDLGRMVAVWDGDRAFRLFIRRPEISPTVKKETVHRLFGDVDALAARLVDVVVDKKREDLLSTIYEEYRNLWDESRGILHADVISAAPISQEQQEAIAEALGRATGHTVMTTLKQDPSLLGGLVIRMGDRVLDGSLIRRLAILGDKLRSGDGGGSVVEH